MKPLGLRPCKFPSKIDHHPREKGVFNWWEVEMDIPSNKRDRREAKQSVQKELNEYYNK